MCLWILPVLFVVILYLSSGVLLAMIGNFLVVDEAPVRSDAVVVLHTGLECYPRLVEAAALYRAGMAGTVVVNGNRQSDVLREIETLGFERCCPWYEDRVRILELLGVSRKDVMTMSVEDAYDTISEAREVGKELLRKGCRRIIITTSKSHTRRAGYIWRESFKDRLSVIVVASKTDPYDPKGWWRDGRQIRWVLAEYGAWVYMFWKSEWNIQKVESPN